MVRGIIVSREDSKLAVSAEIAVDLEAILDESGDDDPDFGKIFLTVGGGVERFL